MVNKRVIFSSLACGLAAGTATWFLYDKVIQMVNDLRKRPVSEDEAEVEAIFDEEDVEDYKVVLADCGYTDYGKVEDDVSDKAESPSEDWLIYKIDLDKFMAWDEDERHVCTWYKKDNVLAGMDDELEMLDADEMFGSYGVKCIGDCDEDSLYLLRADDGQAFEIVMSNEDYETDYAEYQVMRESMGYLQEE